MQDHGNLDLCNNICDNVTVSSWRELWLMCPLIWSPEIEITNAYFALLRIWEIIMLDTILILKDEIYVQFGGSEKLSISISLCNFIMSLYYRIQTRPIYDSDSKSILAFAFSKALIIITRILHQQNTYCHFVSWHPAVKKSCGSGFIVIDIVHKSQKY